MSSTQSAPPPSPRVELQVGERRFTTLASTLTTNSTFFASLLARWQESQSGDGSYFVDADPELFTHILRYLRREILPVVWGKGSGFDRSFYRALQEEAAFLGIERLRKWIEEEGYLKAVTVRYAVQEIKGDGVDEGYDATVDGNTEREYHPWWGTEKVYRCPRDISRHRGNPGACGKACEKAKGEGEDEYVDEDVLRTLVVTKKIIFNDVNGEKT